jgi:hypothetical protein
MKNQLLIAAVAATLGTSAMADISIDEEWNRMFRHSTNVNLIKEMKYAKHIEVAGS